MIFETHLHNTSKTTITQGDKMSYYIKKQNSDSFYSLLDSLFDNTYYKDLYSQKNSNIIQDDDSIIIEIEAIGLSKKDINIEVKDNVLHVSYKNEKQDPKKYSQQQIFFDSFENKYKLKNNMDSENISATMVNGLLNIKIPKIKSKTNSRIKIT